MKKLVFLFSLTISLILLSSCDGVIYDPYPMYSSTIVIRSEPILLTPPPPRVNFCQRPPIIVPQQHFDIRGGRVQGRPILTPQRGSNQPFLGNGSRGFVRGNNGKIVRR